jgi:hypothetical protein
MSKEQRFDIHQHITDQIVAAIERGAGEFRLLWALPGGGIVRPVNVASRKRYRGVNVVALCAAAEETGCASGPWGTYRQTSALIRNKSSARDSYRLPFLSSTQGSAAVKIAAVASMISTPTESGKNGAKTSSSEARKASIFAPKTAGEVVDRVNARSTDASGVMLCWWLTLTSPIFLNRLSSNQC